MIRALLLAAIAIVVLGQPARADVRPDADEDRVAARELSEQGRAFHRAGDYAAAIDAFLAAYQRRPSAALLFNLGQAYRLAGDCMNASRMYRQFLSERPGADLRAVTQEHLASLATCVRSRSGPSTTATLAGMEQAAGPTMKPGARLYDRTRLDPIPADRTARTARRLGVAFMVTGALELAVAGYFALDAHRASSDVAAHYRMGGPWKDIAETDARGHRSSEVATIFGAIGGASIITGVIAYVIGRRGGHDEHPPQARVAIEPRHGGGYAGVSWVF